MKRSSGRIAGLVAAIAALSLATTGVAQAAHGSRAMEQHMRLMASGNPGMARTMELAEAGNPGMQAMMNAPAHSMPPRHP